MRLSVPCGMLLVLLGGTAIRADDEPKPSRALAGNWQRSFGVMDKDGVNIVTPQLRFSDRGKKWSLLVSGTPPTVYWNPLPPMSDLVVPEGAKEGELALIVKDGTGKRQVRFEYTIEKDTLTIRCQEKVPAGPWLGDYDISGKWLRLKATDR